MTLGFQCITLAALASFTAQHGVACQKTAVLNRAITVCVPSGWFVEDDGGHFFACSDPGGNCLTRVGSAPVAGHAGFSGHAGGVPSSEVPADSTKFEAWVQRRKDEGRRLVPYRELKPPSTWPTGSRIVQFRTPFIAGSWPDEGYWIYDFLIKYGTSCFRFSLTFGFCERRARDFVSLGEAMVLSIEQGRR